MKEFLKSDIVRNNAFKLARRIFDDGFKPDIMYVSMRGGAYMGNAMNEFFKIIYGKEYNITFATLVAHSYSGVYENSDVKLKGWTYPPEKIKADDKILVVDDICDSGSTFQFLNDFFLNLGLSRKNIKFAVHDYKCFYDMPKYSVNFIPDYWCRRHDIHNEQENIWIHYLSHELIGLTKEEIEENYFKQYPELIDTFKGVLI